MIPLSVSEKLQRLAAGEQFPASQLRHAVITELINEGIIAERISGRTKTTLYLTDVAALNNWLFNKYTINDLEAYVIALKDENTSRTGMVQASNDSKTQGKRSFKGFLVNSYTPVEALLNGKSCIIYPEPGTFRFIYDFENFIPAHDVVIVGVENAENFRWVEKQQYFFPGIKPLFVSRYPQEQGKDLIRWLQSIPNRYLHFGDFDFAGINIYQQEYKKHLQDKASFFIPENIEELIQKYGSKKLYDQQKLNEAITREDNLRQLISLFHRYKMCVEQEALLLIG